MSHADSSPPGALNRRRLLQAAVVAPTAVMLLPATAFAVPNALSEVLQERFGEALIKEGRVTLSLPALAENGNSVEMTVDVDSPMTQADHVELIAVFAGKNPVPQIAAFHLGPHNGQPRVTTRIRLADSQSVMAVARMSDGSLWSGSARTVVTLAACLDLT